MIGMEGVVRDRGFWRYEGRGFGLFIQIETLFMLKSF